MRSYGVKSRDFHTERFGLFVPDRPAVGLLPTTVEYQYLFSPVDDQGDFSSCIFHASKGILDAIIRKRSKVDPGVSWRALYSATKHLFESNDLADDGAVIEHGLNLLMQYGYVEESAWTDVDVTPDNVLTPVPDDLFVKTDTVTSILRVGINEESFCHALYGHGPIIIGVNWPSAWEFPTDASGILDPNVSDIAGGHCVVITGYRRQSNVTYYHIRNSWGTAWGDRGYGWMPASGLGFVTNAYTVQIP